MVGAIWPAANPMAVIGIWAAAYLLGGVPVGWLVGRLAGVDLRRVGTGKIGTSNLFHTVGLLPASVVGPLQFCQGLLPPLAATLLRAPAWVVAGAGICAVIGNGWPIYLQYNGGRGVASATGAVAIWWWQGFIFVVALVLLGGLLRRSAPSVLLAFLGLPLVLWLSGAPGPYAVTSVGILICLLLRRFEGYRPGHADPGQAPESWLTRLLFDRVPTPAELSGRSIDSQR